MPEIFKSYEPVTEQDLAVIAEGGLWSNGDPETVWCKLPDEKATAPGCWHIYRWKGGMLKLSGSAHPDGLDFELKRM